MTHNANHVIRDRMLRRSMRKPYTMLAGIASKSLDGLFDKLAKQTTNGLKRVKKRGRGVLGRIGVHLLFARNKRLIRAEVGKIFKGVILPRLHQIGAIEAEWLRGMLKRAGVDSAGLNLAQLAKSIESGQMAGASLKGWQRSLERSIIMQTEKSIRDGLRRGDTGAEIGRGVKTGKRSPLRRAKANIRGITKAAITHARNQSTAAVTRGTAGVDREEWVSVLDERTSLLCIGLDGKIFKAGVGLYPPAHPNCRSIRVPYLKGVDDPARQTYREFLAGQDEEFVDDVLGPTRGSEFRQLIGRGVDPNRIRFANVKQLKPLRVKEFARSNRNK